MCTLPSCLCWTNKSTFTHPHEGAPEGAVSCRHTHARMRINILTGRHHDSRLHDARRITPVDARGALDSRDDSQSKHSRGFPESDINC